MKLKINVVLLILWVSYTECGISNWFQEWEEILQRGHRKIGTRQTEVDTEKNFVGAEIKKDVSSKGLSLHDVEETNPTSSSNGVKTKRCPLVAAYPEKVGSIHRQSSSPLVRARNGIQPDSSPAALQISRRDLLSRNLINDRLCNTCRGQASCRILKKCDQCEKICSKVQNDTTQNHDETSIFPDENGESGTTAASANGENHGLQDVKLTSRFGRDQEEEHPLKNIYPVAVLKSGPSKEIMCNLLGIANHSSIDTLVVWATTKSNLAPEFKQGNKKDLSQEIENLTTGVNNHLSKARQNNENKSINDLTTKDIREIMENIVSEAPEIDHNSRESHESNLFTKKPETLENPQLKHQASFDDVEYEGVLQPDPIRSQASNAKLPKISNLYLEDMHHNPSVIHDTPPSNLLGKKHTTANSEGSDSTPVFSSINNLQNTDGENTNTATDKRLTETPDMNNKFLRNRHGEAVELEEDDERDTDNRPLGATTDINNIVLQRNSVVKVESNTDRTVALTNNLENRDGENTEAGSDTKLVSDSNSLVGEQDPNIIIQPKEFQQFDDDDNDFPNSPEKRQDTSQVPTTSSSDLTSPGSANLEKTTETTTRPSLMQTLKILRENKKNRFSTPRSNSRNWLEKPSGSLFGQFTPHNSGLQIAREVFDNAVTNLSPNTENNDDGINIARNVLDTVDATQALAPQGFNKNSEGAKQSKSSLAITGKQLMERNQAVHGNCCLNKKTLSYCQFTPRDSANQIARDMFDNVNLSNLSPSTENNNDGINIARNVLDIVQRNSDEPDLSRIAPQHLNENTEVPPSSTFEKNAPTNHNKVLTDQMSQANAALEEVKNMIKALQDQNKKGIELPNEIQPTLGSINMKNLNQKLSKSSQNLGQTNDEPATKIEAISDPQKEMSENIMNNLKKIQQYFLNRAQDALDMIDDKEKKSKQENFQNPADQNVGSQFPNTVEDSQQEHSKATKTAITHLKKMPQFVLNRMQDTLNSFDHTKLPQQPTMSESNIQDITTDIGSTSATIITAPNVGNAARDDIASDITDRTVSLNHDNSILSAPNAGDTTDISLAHEANSNEEDTLRKTDSTSFFPPLTVDFPKNTPTEDTKQVRNTLKSNIQKMLKEKQVSRNNKLSPHLKNHVGEKGESTAPTGFNSALPNLSPRAFEMPEISENSILSNQPFREDVLTTDKGENPFMESNTFITSSNNEQSIVTVNPKDRLHQTLDELKNKLYKKKLHENLAATENNVNQEDSDSISTVNKNKLEHSKNLLKSKLQKYLEDIKLRKEKKDLQKETPVKKTPGFTKIGDTTELTSSQKAVSISSSKIPMAPNSEKTTPNTLGLPVLSIPNNDNFPPQTINSVPRILRPVAETGGIIQRSLPSNNANQFFRYKSPEESTRQFPVQPQVLSSRLSLKNDDEKTELVSSTGEPGNQTAVLQSKGTPQEDKGEWSQSLGKIVHSSSKPSDVFFIGNGIKLPLQVQKNHDGSLDLSVDIDKLCSCKNSTNCPKNRTAVEETVGEILKDEAVLKRQLIPNRFENTEDDITTSSHLGNVRRERETNEYSVVNHVPPQKENNIFRRSPKYPGNLELFSQPTTLSFQNLGDIFTSPKNNQPNLKVGDNQIENDIEKLRKSFEKSKKATENLIKSNKNSAIKFQKSDPILNEIEQFKKQTQAALKDVKEKYQKQAEEVINEINKNIEEQRETVATTAENKMLFTPINFLEENNVYPYDNSNPKNLFRYTKVQDLENTLEKLNNDVEVYKEESEKLLEKGAKTFFKSINSKHPESKVVKQELGILNNILSWMKGLTAHKNEN